MSMHLVFEILLQVIREERREYGFKTGRPYIDQFVLRANPHEAVVGWRATAHGLIEPVFRRMHVHMILWKLFRRREEQKRRVFYTSPSLPVNS